MVMRILVALLISVTLGVLGVFLFLRSVGFYRADVYEMEPPEMPVIQRPAILVLSKTNGFIHKDAIPAGQTMLKRIAADNGWDIYITDNAASHNAADLKKFSVVVWNNVSGDVLTLEQRKAMKNWIEQGGGWVGIHAAGGDPEYKWNWYVETLLRTQFVGHTMWPQFQDADVYVTDHELEVTCHLPSPWRVPHEEWYAFDTNPRNNGAEILLTVDEDSYLTKGETWLGGRDTMVNEHPITWRHSVGQGRAFYTAIGHRAETYSIGEFQTLIANGIFWAAGGTP